MTECRDILPMIRDYLEETLDPAESLLVAEHLDLCPECTRCLTAIVDDARSDELQDVAALVRRADESAIPVRGQGRTDRVRRLPVAVFVSIAVALAMIAILILIRIGAGSGTPIGGPKDATPARAESEVDEALRSLRSLGPTDDEDIGVEEYDFDDGSQESAVMVALRSRDRRLVRRRSGDESAVPIGGRNGGVTWYLDAGEDRIVVSPENLPSAIIEPAPPIGPELHEWLDDAGVRVSGFDTVGGVRGLVLERAAGRGNDAASRLTVEPSSGRVLSRVDRREDGRRCAWKWRGRRRDLKDLEFLPGSWIARGVRLDVDWAAFESDGVGIDAIFEALRARSGGMGSLRPIRVAPGVEPRDALVEALLSDSLLSSALGPKGREQLAEAVARVFEKGESPLGSVILSEKVILDPPPGLMKSVSSSLLEKSKSVSGFARALGEETGVKIEITCDDRPLPLVAYPSKRPMAIELLSAVAAFSGLELRFERDRVVIFKAEGK